MKENVERCGGVAVMVQENRKNGVAGLGAMAGKVWRIGLMGHACTPCNARL